MAEAVAHPGDRGDAVSSLLLLVGILAGAVTLRVTGIGFALVAAPFFVLSLGPWDALGLLHLSGVLACLMLAWRLRHDVDWGRAVELGGWATLMIVPGTWLAWSVPERALQLVIGVGLLASLLVMVSFRELPMKDGPVVRAVGGLACGLFTYTAGMGGPAMTIYSRLARWPHIAFVATLQPMFAILAIGGVAARQVVAGSALPHMTWWTWVLASGMLLCGLVVGDLVASRIPVHRARRAVLAVAFAGTLVTIGQAAMP